MGIFGIVREHAAVATGNFATMFKDTEFPPLPAAIAALVTEINKAEPDVGQLEAIISTEASIAVKVLHTVNSSLFALETRVVSVRHAIALLGLQRIRSLILSYALVEHLPRAEGTLFNHKAFWTDSMLRALLARAFSKRFGKCDAELAFTAMLVSDIALPVLLSSWRKYYEPVVEHWLEEPERLSEIETDYFGWNHSQATSWLLHHWEFPEELVCVAGAHDLEPGKIGELGLAATSALPVAVAALLPSTLKPQPERHQRMVQMAAADLGVALADWPVIAEEIAADFVAVADLFGLSSVQANETLDRLREAAQADTQADAPADAQAEGPADAQAGAPADAPANALTEDCVVTGSGEES